MKAELLSDGLGVDNEELTQALIEPSTKSARTYIRRRVRRLSWAIFRLPSKNLRPAP